MRTMNQHDHDHHGHDHHAPSRPKRGGLHKDWRTWLVVGLMLAAMAAYVLTDGRIACSPAAAADGRRCRRAALTRRS